MLLLFILFLIVVCFTPVYQFNVQSGDKVLFSYPVSSGQILHTGYIHSVQLTPVEDDYRILNSRLWLWEERVVSHNAGLPFDAPSNGSFFSDDRWMYIRGGRYNWHKVNLRVGDADLGRNWMKLDPFCTTNLYEFLPGRLLQLSVGERPLILAALSEVRNLFLKAGRNDEANR